VDSALSALPTARRAKSLRGKRISAKIKPPEHRCDVPAALRFIKKTSLFGWIAIQHFKKSSIFAANNTNIQKTKKKY
jgi:hypothetical protein